MNSQPVQSVALVNRGPGQTTPVPPVPSKVLVWVVGTCVVLLITYRHVVYSLAVSKMQKNRADEGTMQSVIVEGGRLAVSRS